MGYKEITAGDRVGRAITARFMESPKTKTPGIEIEFEFEEPSTGQTERLNWQGWLSERAIEMTMDTLVNVLGYNGSEETDDKGILTDPNAFAYGMEVKLVIELEEYNNKQYPKIKWVNTIGGSAYAACKPQAISGLKAAFLAAKQQVVTPAVKPETVPF